MDRAANSGISGGTFSFDCLTWQLRSPMNWNSHAVELVSAACERFGMAKEKSDELSAHVLQAGWFGKRLKRINEALVALSGTFIGFLGIELPFLGRLGPREINIS